MLDLINAVLLCHQEGEFREYANRRETFNGGKIISDRASEKAHEVDQPTSSLRCRWIRRHLPSLVQAVLVESGPSIPSRTILGRNKAGHRRACPGYHREPRSAFRIDSPDLARSEISGGSLRIADSFPGGFSGRPGSCQTPPVPRNLYRKEAECGTSSFGRNTT